MLSARNLVVLFGACLVPGMVFAQDVPATLDSPLAAKPDSQKAPSPLSPEDRGDVYMARKMYREAIEAYEQAPQNSAIVWNKMGIAYHQMMNLDAAMKRYRRSIKLDSKYAEAVNNLGTVYYAEKHFAKAIGCYKHALKLAPGAASMYSNLGTAYYAQNKLKEFWQAYNKALQLDPEVFEHRNGYGVLLQDRTVAQRARYHYFLARMYAAQGRHDLALQYIRRALEEGFSDRKKLMQDPEFAAMRDLPEFKELLKLEPRVL